MSDHMCSPELPLEPCGSLSLCNPVTEYCSEATLTCAPCSARCNTSEEFCYEKCYCIWLKTYVRKTSTTISTIISPHPVKEVEGWSTANYIMVLGLVFGLMIVVLFLFIGINWIRKRQKPRGVHRTVPACEQGEHGIPLMDMHTQPRTAVWVGDLPPQTLCNGGDAHTSLSSPNECPTRTTLPTQASGPDTQNLPSQAQTFMDRENGHSAVHASTVPRATTIGVQTEDITRVRDTNGIQNTNQMQPASTMMHQRGDRRHTQENGGRPTVPAQETGVPRPYPCYHGASSYNVPTHHQYHDMMHNGNVAGSTFQEARPDLDQTDAKTRGK